MKGNPLRRLGRSPKSGRIAIPPILPFCRRSRKPPGEALSADWVVRAPKGAGAHPSDVGHGGVRRWCGGGWMRRSCRGAVGGLVVRLCWCRAGPSGGRVVPDRGVGAFVVSGQILSDLAPRRRCAARGVGSSHVGNCVGVGCNDVVAVHGGGAGRFAAAAGHAPASGRWRATLVEVPGSSCGNRVWRFGHLTSLGVWPVPARCRSRPGVEVGCRRRVTSGRGGGSGGWRRCGRATRHRQGCRSSTWSAPASPLLRFGGSLIDLVVLVAGGFVGGRRLPIGTLSLFTAMEGLRGVLFPGRRPGWWELRCWWAELAA
uniref:Uncharacterized protein n=2 Tax=Aegilops tauschii subsp. strangulata TaxID=200361 RepID=A0A452XZR5_AEGTS